MLSVAATQFITNNSEQNPSW